MNILTEHARLESIHPSRLGAELLPDGVCRFLVWAPNARKVDICFETPHAFRAPMSPAGGGYFAGAVQGVAPGATYLFELDGGTKRPDPASRFQPSTVHAASAVVDPHFPWGDAGWRGVELKDYVIYELHVGTFTPEGTFDAVVPHLGELKNLGITAVEIMPVAQFPGRRNWGYDGVYPFAVQNSYGGPDGLKRLVNACHGAGLAVVLDVVYNHLGPEGNYLSEFGPYFTDRYQTPWSLAVNFDGPESDHVRRFFLENAEMWLSEFHIDALRLDAVHAIRDFSAVPFLSDLARLADSLGKKWNRNMYLIAESDLNDSRLIRLEHQGGIGLHAQWNDDVHHVIHALLTGERDGYYQDFGGGVAQLKKAVEEGYVFTGEHSAFRKRRHGNSSKDLDPAKFVVFSQNHDQVGNRMMGERLSTLVSFEAQKLAAGLVLLSPYLPLLFMGEEYGETAPFQYFVDHGDPALLEAVRKGRKEEFAGFQWQGEPPDPGSEKTFLTSRLNHRLREEEPHRTMRSFYQTLLALRKSEPEVWPGTRAEMMVEEINGALLAVKFRCSAGDLLIIFNTIGSSVEWRPPETGSSWIKVFDSADIRWKGPGSSVPEKINAGMGTAVVVPGLSFVVLRSAS